MRDSNDAVIKLLAQIVSQNQQQPWYSATPIHIATVIYRAVFSVVNFICAGMLTDLQHLQAIEHHNTLLYIRFTEQLDELKTPSNAASYQAMVAIDAQLVELQNSRRHQVGRATTVPMCLLTGLLLGLLAPSMPALLLYLLEKAPSPSAPS